MIKWIFGGPGTVREAGVGRPPPCVMRLRRTARHAEPCWALHPDRVGGRPAAFSSKKANYHRTDRADFHHFHSRPSRAGLAQSGEPTGVAPILTSAAGMQGRSTWSLIALLALAAGLVAGEWHPARSFRCLLGPRETVLPYLGPHHPRMRRHLECCEKCLTVGPRPAGLAWLPASRQHMELCSQLCGAQVPCALIRELPTSTRQLVKFWLSLWLLQAGHCP